jgi:hypothetical protein
MRRTLEAGHDQVKMNKFMVSLDVNSKFKVDWYYTYNNA